MPDDTECAFGMLANKWRIFHRPIDVDNDFADSIIKAACVLHNFVRIRDKAQEKTFGDGDIPQSLSMDRLQPHSRNKGNARALTARDKYANYFSNV